MQKRSMKTSSIDEFIKRYPRDTQLKLQQLRQVIHGVAPEAKEKISYGIPTFFLKGNLVHFSAYEKHIGFYPGAAVIIEFADKLKNYDTSKGTIRLPVDKPLPLDLIQDIVRFRVESILSQK